MLVRVVYMTFREEEVLNFIALFKAHQKQIRHFPGCLHLELWRDKQNPCVMSTFSHWESEEALESYRQSTLFAEVWPKTKALFAEKPIARSHERLISVE